MPDSARADDPSATEPAPLRVLAVGDSVTHGTAGDWTWRYRLWQHLAAQPRGVDMVGPRDDLWDPVAGEGGSHDYVDPDFDDDHAARWGMTFAFLDWDVTELVAAHHPDVVVEMLGVNDVNFLGFGPDDVAREARELVTDARAADPTVDVVIALVPHTWYAGIPEVNAALADVAAQLDDEVARVVVADTAADFDRKAGTWDGTHPSARGEVVLAAAVADALHVLDLAPSYPRPLPVLPLGPRLPAPMRVTAGDGRATVTWTGSPGADTHRWWWRDVTAQQRWTRREDLPTSGSRRIDGLVNGHVYETFVQPVKGWWPAAADVRVVRRVRPLPPPPGAPARPTARSPRRDVVVATSTAVRRADTYALQVATSRSCRLTGLRFRTVRSSLSSPRATFSTRSPAVHVRFVARNLAGASPPSRSTCVAVR